LNLRVIANSLRVPMADLFEPLSTK
jgi:hypothetical protein